MAPEKKTFINVDQLMPQVSVEDVARYFGIELPVLGALSQLLQR